MGKNLLWYTFVAIIAYLLLVHWRGANTLLGGGAKAYIGGVKALQGR